MNDYLTTQFELVSVRFHVELAEAHQSTSFTASANEPSCLDDTFTSSSSSSDCDTSSLTAGKAPKRPSSRRYAGSAKYITTFKSSRKNTYSFVAQAKQPDHIRCTICDKDVSCETSGY